MKLFENLLINTCNPLSGYKRWWFIATVGIAVMCIWVVAALPWVGAFTGMDSLGDIVLSNSMSTLSFVAYGGVFSISDPAAPYYFLCVLLGIALAKFGYLLFLLGLNYGRGCVYLGKGRWSH